MIRRVSTAIPPKILALCLPIVALAAIWPAAAQTPGHALIQGSPMLVEHAARIRTQFGDGPVDRCLGSDGASTQDRVRACRDLTNFNTASRSDPFLHFALALAYYDLGDLANASMSMAQARTHAPTDGFIIMLAGGIEAEFDPEHDYIADLEEAARVAPENPAIWFNLGQEWIKLGNVVAAIGPLDRAVDLRPMDPVARYTRAAAHEIVKNYDAALDDYQWAIAAGHPDAALIHARRGSILLLREDYSSAERAWRNAADADPAVSRSWNNLCWAQALLSREVAGESARQDLLRTAWANCDKALEIDFRSAVAFDSRGLVHLLLKNNAAAQEDYNAAFVTNPQAWNSLYGRGVAKMRLGRTEEGHADMRRALEMNPEAARPFIKLGINP